MFQVVMMHTNDKMDKLGSGLEGESAESVYKHFYQMIWSYHQNTVFIVSFQEIM